MNRILKSGLFFMLLVGMMFVSCKKEYDVPPIPQLPYGDTLTIDQILAMPTEVPFESASVCGIVTADEQSGNLYKQIFIQDRTTGKGIELIMNSSSAARIGDSVRVYLDSTMIAYQNHGLPQLTGLQGKGFSPDGHLVIYPYNKPIEPKTVTIADIKSGQYLASLVRIENIEFTQTGTFADAGGSGNRYVVDPSSPAEDQNFIVRTSNYANFAYDNLPEGPGSMVAIATIYNSTWQLIIRSKNEMKFENWTPTPPTPAGEVQSLPYNQSFASGFGTYMSYSVIDDNHVWSYEGSYSIVQMTGHVGGNPGENYANEDWLISSPVAVTGVGDAKMTMVYLGRYFDNINNDVTIWVSNDYTYGENPTTAQWTQLPATLSESSSWSDFKTVELALTEFVGQTINVAVKYLSTDTKGGTIEVASITVEEGTAGGDTPPGPGPGTLEGNGSRENPYTANDIILLGIETSDGNKYWVKDYIVGVINSSYVYEFTSNTDVNTNIILSSNQNAGSESECIPIQLPAGEIRTGLNLSDNPNNLGQEVLLYGTLEKYFRVPGVKNVTYAEINGNSFGTDPGGDTPPTPPTPGETIFSESFANGQGEFVIKDVSLPSGLSFVWSHVSNYSCMKANGYYQHANDAESWLVSPKIDLSEVSTATLKFDHAASFASPQGYFFVKASTDYAGDVTAATWTELAVSKWPDHNSNWTFVSATADLSGFVGQEVTIAFEYTSTQDHCAAWEVKNVVVE